MRVALASALAFFTMPERIICVLTPGQAGSSLLCAILNKVCGVSFGAGRFVGNNPNHKFGSYEHKGMEDGLRGGHWPIEDFIRQNPDVRILAVKHPELADNPKLILSTPNLHIVFIDRDSQKIIAARKRTGLYTGKIDFGARRRNLHLFLGDHPEIPTFRTTFDDLAHDPVDVTRRLHSFVWAGLDNAPVAQPAKARELFDPSMKHA